MKFLNFFLLLWVIFALLDPDPDSEYGSGSGYTNLIESGSNPDPSIVNKNSEDSYCIVTTFFDFLSLKSNVNEPSNSKKQKTSEKISLLLAS
jgi:hypothetical protein